MKKKIVTVGIPAYKAQSTIPTLLSSISIQTIVDNIDVIIVNDDPADKGTYEFVKERFPQLSISIVDNVRNLGPGGARQSAFDHCKTPWITFADADDIYLHAFAFEEMKRCITPDCAMIQSPFCQEIEEGHHPQGLRMMPRGDIAHPWMFSRWYNVNFIKQNNISFYKDNNGNYLRAMEDGYWNWCCKLLIEGSPLKINTINNPGYLWRTGSEHSITRIGIEENDGEPIYNRSLCQLGATVAAINAIKFARKANPFNGSNLRFTVEHMVDLYFTYIKCKEQKPMFAEQNYFNAKRFYNECYKDIEQQIDDKILKDMYTLIYARQGEEMLGIIPEITFFQFMSQIKSEDYGGKSEFDEIRNRLPQWVVDLEKKSGVLGEEGFI